MDNEAIERQHRINRSNVRKIFTPSAPIDDINLFCGRTEEVESIYAYLTTVGEHALLFGDRGVGKSSLANILKRHLFPLVFDRENIFEKKCGTSDNFITILDEPLRKFGHLKINELLSSKSSKQGAADVKAFFANAGVKSQTDSTTSFEVLNRELTPTTVAKIMSRVSGALVIDELDRLHVTLPN